MKKTDNIVKVNKMNLRCNALIKLIEQVLIYLFIYLYLTNIVVLLFNRRIYIISISLL